MSGTFWAVLPPVIAIALALLTREVYSSLFIGIFVGALMFTASARGDRNDVFDHERKGFRQHEYHFIFGYAGHFGVSHYQIGRLARLR